MKFEYKVVKMGGYFKFDKPTEKDIEKKCQELGELGWELVNFQCYDVGSKFILIFKREKNS